MINDIIQLLVNSLFAGTLVLVVCIVLTLVFKIQQQTIDINILTFAVNWLLLLEGVLFLGSIFTTVFTAYYSAGEYEQYTFNSHISTGAAVTLVIFIFLTHGMIPQLLWVTKLRRSITVSAIMVGVWGLYHLVRVISVASYIPSSVSLRDIITWTITYIVILSATYILAKKKLQS